MSNQIPNCPELLKWLKWYADNPSGHPEARIAIGEAEGRRMRIDLPIQPPRTELDSLLDRVREDKADTAGKNRNQVAYDCWRMFEDLAMRYKEESEMRDRYKRQSNSWRDVAFDLLDAVRDALAFLDRPDITTYEWYKLAPEHIRKFRQAITKAEGLIG